MPSELSLVATCALGLEELLADELRSLHLLKVAVGRGAVTFNGSWRDVWRANLWLRTANRVLIEVGHWPAGDDAALEQGAARMLDRSRLLSQVLTPERTLAVRATSSRSKIRDVRWVALKVKDGLVDAQRERHGARSSVERRWPDVPLRLWLHSDRAALLLDTSGQPLDRRGYRVRTTDAPLREQLAAACVLASGWDRRGPVVDPMCGSGALLVEAAWIAQNRPPGLLRKRWVFERWPSFERAQFLELRDSAAGEVSAVELVGGDRSKEAIEATRSNLEKAGVAGNATLRIGDGFEIEPPAEPGLFVVNPPYGERSAADETIWPRLGDLLKQRYRGWTAVVLAGDPSRGKHIGLRPKRRIPVRNGPIEARILVFELY